MTALDDTTKVKDGDKLHEEAPQPSPPSAPRAPTPQAPTDSKQQVLVVDDDLLTRMLMKRMLTRMGCDVTTAENGELALEQILQSKPPEDTTSESDQKRFAVVFMDNQMPVLSGLKTIARLRELGRTDFVVGVTGVYLPTYVLYTP